MSNEAIAIGSILSIFIALVIDLIVIPDQLNVLTVLSNFSFVGPGAIDSIAGLMYYLIIYSISDTFTSIAVATLLNVQHAVERF